MTNLLASALLILIVCANVTRAANFSMSGAARDPGVKRWVSYQIASPRNHPQPIIYLSTQHFRTNLDEKLLVLSRPRYDVVAKYTRLRIASADCPVSTAVDDIGYTIEVTEGDRKRSQRCTMPAADACAFLFGMKNLPGINWTAKERRPITTTMLTMGCENSSAAGNGSSAGRLSERFRKSS
jgi:hypothetical protein